MNESSRTVDVVVATTIARARAELPTVAATLLVSLATSACFIQVFGTWSFVWPLMSMALFVHVLGVLIRTVRLPPLFAFGFSILTVYLGVGWLRYADTLRFGLPLSRSWSAIWSDLRSAWDLLGDVSTPVSFATGFGTLSLVVIGLVTAATDAFAIRYGARIEVFVPGASTLFIVAAVGTGQGRLIVTATWLGAALVAAAILRAAPHVGSGVPRPRVGPRSAVGRSILPIVAFAAVVMGATVLIAPLLPGAGDEAWLTQRSQEGARQLQPFVDVRRRLLESEPTVLFTVRADQSAYWRISSLPDFDGSRWTISQRLLDTAAGQLSPPMGTKDMGADALVNLQKFTIDSLAGSFVPVAATPTQLRSSTQSLFYEPESGTLLVAGDGLRARDSYEIQSTMISPSPTRLASATSTTPPDDAYLEIPDSASIARLSEIASSIAPANLSGYEKALALQDYFRSQFTYSLDVPSLTETDATLEFLERRSGYCEHFSSTFALFARLVGLPARVAIGFTSGDRGVSDSGTEIFVVRSSHAHAWPEVWFDDLGWVLFEPTPGRGAPNAQYTNVPAVEPEESAPPSTAPTSTTSTSMPDGPTFPSPSGGSPDSLAPAPSESTSSGSLEVLAILIGIAIAAGIWALVMPTAIRYLAIRRTESPLLRLWRQALALYEFERGTFPRSKSPRELASLATSRLYDDDPFIVELADLAARILFDPTGADSPRARELVVEGPDYLRERRRRLGILRRIRSRFDPFAAWKLEGGTRTRFEASGESATS